jgi:hypothetical protein
MRGSVFAGGSVFADDPPKSKTPPVDGTATPAETAASEKKPDAKSGDENAATKSEPDKSNDTNSATGASTPDEASPGAGSSRPDANPDGNAGSNAPAAVNPPAATPLSNADRQKWHKQLPIKKPEERLAALKALTGHPNLETTKRVYKHCFDRFDSQTRNAIRDLLISYKGDAAVTKFMLTEFRSRVAKEGLTPITYMLIEVFAEHTDTGTRRSVCQALDSILPTPKVDLGLLNRYIDELGLRGDVGAMKTLRLLSECRFWESQFGFRRAIVMATTLIRDKSAIEFLVHRLANTRGLVQHDIVQYLTNVTGQRFQDDEKMWVAWWQKNEPYFRFPGLPLPKLPIDDKRPAYYGIPICAKRIVFVMDISGSMRGQRIDAAKRELVNAINNLPSEVYFSIVFFSTFVKSWQPNMVPATPEFKTQARVTVLDQQAIGDTATFPALEMAFSLDPEAIYLLSDGAPTSGRLIDPRDIIETVATTNHVRRVSLHTIGVGTGAPENLRLLQFMQSLANANYGEFRSVDQ